MRKKVWPPIGRCTKLPTKPANFFASFCRWSRDTTATRSWFARLISTWQPRSRRRGGRTSSIGGQNVHWKAEGAFTGEISAPMLSVLGVTHVIIGHSERRQYFGETDDTVNLRLKTALESGLTPICCVGEVLEEREAGLDRRCAAPPVRARVSCHLGEEGGETGRGLRTGVGDRHGEDGHAGDRG